MITICRIFGISYGEYEEAISTAKIGRLLYRSLIHGGPDAWGYMRWDGADVTYQKFPGRVDTKEALRLFTDYAEASESKWIVGHVRKATNGIPSYNGNNHPLMHGDIIGVHNGKLINHDTILDVTGRQDSHSEVDSEAIFAAVNRWGHEPGLRKIVGAMVTVYADVRKPHLLHIGRSYERSLSVGWTERGNFIFASERPALERLERHGIKFTGFSNVREMRHLIVQDGQIVHRATYGKAPAAYAPMSWSRRTPPLLPVPDDELRRLLREEGLEDWDQIDDWS